MSEMHDLVAPYALDALDSEERAAFEEHLETCSRCTEELTLLQDAANSLAEANRTEPPPDLKSKVLRLVDDDEPAGTPAVLAQSRQARIGWSLAATAAVVALVFAGLWAVASSQLSDAQRVAQVLEAPDANFVELVSPQGSAHFVYSPSLGEGVFVGGSLVSPPEENVYQLWLVDDSGAAPSRTFRPEDTASVLVEGVSPGQTIAMTIEPRGGSESPTGDILVTGDL